MKKRRMKLSKSVNKKLFSRTARKVHRRNLSGRARRGGIRL